MQRRKARNACGFVNQLFARQLSQKRGKVSPPICLRDLAPACLSCTLHSARSCSAHKLQHLPLLPIQTASLRSPPTTISAGFQQQQWAGQWHRRGQPWRHHVSTIHCALQLGESTSPCCSSIRPPSLFHRFERSQAIFGAQCWGLIQSLPRRQIVCTLFTVRHSMILHLAPMTATSPELRDS